MTMDSILRLPVVHNWAMWASINRGDAASIDIAENWRLLWAKIVESYSGTSAGKTSSELEIEGINYILDDFSQTLPLKVSLEDSRKWLYRFLCSANGLNCEGLQLRDLLYTVLGPEVFIPLKFTDGDNRLFHCGFNGFTYDEQSGTTITDNRKLDFINGGAGTFMGLRSDANDTFAWPVTMPTLADFSALTVRWIFKMPADGVLRFGPITGDSSSTNGAFDIRKKTDDTLQFTIHDGSSQENVISDSAITNNALTEVWGIVDGTNMKMYVDGVLQADTETLAAAPAFYTAAGVGLGFAGIEFKGINYEFAIHGDVITP